MKTTIDLIREIRSGDTLLAIQISSEALCAEGSHFFSNDLDFIQLASHHYEKGKSFLPHQHHNLPRISERTQEVLLVLNGALKADIFDHDHNLVDSFLLEKGDVVVLLDGGHGFTVLTNNTRFIEIKNGPYLGAEKDRFRLFN